MVDYNALARLASPASVGQSFAAGLELGQQKREKIEQDRALAQYAQAPSEQTANALLRYAPELGLKLGEVQRNRAFGEAASTYMGRGKPNALAFAQPPQIPGAVSGYGGGAFDAQGREVTQVSRGAEPVSGMTGNALQPSPVGALGSVPRSVGSGFMSDGLSPEAMSGMAGAPTQERSAGPVPDGQPASQPDFSVLGAPRSQADASFLEMLRIDPKRAMAIESDMRDRAADRLKLQKDAYGFAVSRLGRVKDAEGYRSALADIASEIEPLGVEITDHLPPEWPGADGLREMRLSALDAKDQLTYLLNEDDRETDNLRADRNTDSLIADRQARFGEARRNNARRDATTRRGQSLRDSTTRRGQDTRGKVPTATDASGNTIYYRSGKWVDAGGKAVQ